MAQYEIAVLYHPSLEVDLSKAEDRVVKIFTDNDAKLINTDNWGKRKLAYPIKKNEYAIYVFYTLEMPGSNLSKVETTLNITDEVIRFLITKSDLKMQAKAEAARALKAEQAAKRDERIEEPSEEQEED
jgi:small subunit ribosomal protein S6